MPPLCSTDLEGSAAISLYLVAYSYFLYLVDVSSLHGDVCCISAWKINSDWGLAVDTAENMWRCIKLTPSIIWQRESLRMQCCLPPTPRLKCYVLETATAQPSPHKHFTDRYTPISAVPDFPVVYWHLLKVFECSEFSRIFFSLVGLE